MGHILLHQVTGKQRHVVVEILQQVTGKQRHVVVVEILGVEELRESVVGETLYSCGFYLWKSLTQP